MRRPNGILTKRNRLNGVLNIVKYEDSLSSLTFQYPFRASSLLKSFAPVSFGVTVEALVSGHPRGATKVSVTGAGRLRECKNTEFL